MIRVLGLATVIFLGGCMSTMDVDPAHFMKDDARRTSTVQLRFTGHEVPQRDELAALSNDDLDAILMRAKCGYWYSADGLAGAGWKDATELGRAAFDQIAIRQHFDESIRVLIRARQAEVGMPAEALAYSWGFPTRVTHFASEFSNAEVWQWDRTYSTATIVDGKVSALSSTRGKY